MALNKQTRPIKEGGGGAGRDRQKPFPVVLNSNNQGSAISSKLPALSAPGDSENRVGQWEQTLCYDIGGHWQDSE